ncbi:MAG: TIGR02270 family protein, partial [Gammaproteobacteria bacterium]
MKSAVISVIVEQHAEEAAFLWILRDAAVRAPHYRLKDLAKLDNRVEAHIDGLRIAGEEGWRLCQEGLRIGEAGEVFAAAMLAFEERNGERIDKLVTVARQSDEAFRGLVSALGWIPHADLQEVLPQLL